MFFFLAVLVLSLNSLSGGGSLSKAVADFVILRMNLKADPLPWPSFEKTLPSVDDSIPTTIATVATSAGQVPGAEREMKCDCEPYTERMCTLDLISSDVAGLNLEVPPPERYTLACGGE